MAVYLIHFDKPYKHSRHYLGYAADVDERIERHRSGSGARLLQVVNAAGIEWQLARTWSGDRKFERWLKRKKGAAWFCPACNGAKAFNRAKETKRWVTCKPLTTTTKITSRARGITSR